MNHKRCETNITRREAIKLGIAGGTAMLLNPLPAWAAESTATPLTDVWVVRGKDPAKKIQVCLKIIDDNGGFVSSTGSLALKVNAAFTREPEEGANTSPQIVDAFLAECQNRQVKDLIIPEYPVHHAQQCFKKSGILKVVNDRGYDMIDMARHKQYFKEVKLPDAKSLTGARVTRQFIEADMVINIPVAKHHGGATLSMAMKNWMGAVEDRKIFHRKNLHQCIADICTIIMPNWTIIDASRIMMDHGPQGPTTNMKYPDLLIISKDQVAADAYASTLFHDSPLQVEYLKIAGQMKLGQIDLAMMNIHKIEVE